MSDESGQEPTSEQIRAMSTEELMRAGAEVDEVHIVHRRERFPVPGSQVEKRAERQVAFWFMLSAAASVAFVVCYIVVPWHYKLGDNGSYAWFTPVLGVCLGLALLGTGVGAVQWAKKLMPEEEVAQERHDGISSEFDREATGATLVSGLKDSGLQRRTLLRRSIGLGAGALGAVAVVPLIGGLIRKPRGELMHTPWKAGVRLVQLDGKPIKPGDMRPGSLATVFPDTGPEAFHQSDTPTMLIRLRPGTQVKSRKGQADYMWGDYIAFSKICTHLGCPVSLYEQETNRILCPCHQSQFDVLQDAKPVFGPATRPLPSLPLAVDDEGYFIARAGYREAVGPAFWERPNHD
ncbi:MAG TPA: Rieske 2Fe-2S domain-containing protein [Mycobacteriales bacterium]|nr:Rieske 2Fe-2S domain-containing protein [Mycobacteriales bacterium]